MERLCESNASSHPRTCGIGVLFHQDEATGVKRIFVAQTAPGGPADRTGRVRQGDLLVAIDGKDMFGQDLEYVSKYILGPEGSAVRLGFYNSNGSSEVVCQRESGASQTALRGAPMQESSTSADPKNPRTCGIGVLFHQDEATGVKRIFVAQIVPGGPADRTGRVRQGDLLVAIDGKDMFGQDLEYVSKYILGPEGSAVRLGFYKCNCGSYAEVAINRGIVASPPCAINATGGRNATSATTDQDRKNGKCKSMIRDCSIFMRLRTQDGEHAYFKDEADVVLKLRTRTTYRIFFMYPHNMQLMSVTIQDEPLDMDDEPPRSEMLSAASTVSSSRHSSVSSSLHDEPPLSDISNHSTVPSSLETNLLRDTTQVRMCTWRTRNFLESKQFSRTKIELKLVLNVDGMGGPNGGDEEHIVSQSFLCKFYNPECQTFRRKGRPLEAIDLRCLMGSVPLSGDRGSRVSPVSSITFVGVSPQDLNTPTNAKSQHDEDRLASRGVHSIYVAL